MLAVKNMAHAPWEWKVFGSSSIPKYFVAEIQAELVKHLRYHFYFQEKK
jgi:hypothetical protein